MLRIRNHPSLVHFLGHDETYPTPTLDKAYQDLIEELDIRRTYQPHSGAFRVRNRTKTGGTRTGTLELWQYAGPTHYYTHHSDGAWGFAQSGGIGGVVAGIESIKRMIPAGELWPLWTEAWSFHTVLQGGHYFDGLVKALDERYGRPASVDDFVETAQVMNYESARGMYEAYARNKYSSTGITTWKYDAAWPAAMTWAYVDWYLLPTGAYYGAKKACEPLHVQYSYDNRSIYVVNSFYQEFKGLQVAAKIYNLDLTEKYSKSETVDVGPDGKTEAFIIEWPQGLSKTYFLDLRLREGSGKEITGNLYWLSIQRDHPGKKLLGMWKISPTSFPDFTALRQLPKVKLEVACTVEKDGDETIAQVTVNNPGQSLAFFTNLAVIKGKAGLEVAPSYWSDNDFAVLPGEEKKLKATFSAADLEDSAPVVRVRGWNLEQVECNPR
jgi:exo-1,4-beta-D-glucosaminidase